ncbi:F-box and associated interaction domains-containing protein, partial [Striga asiatica]
YSHAISGFSPILKCSRRICSIAVVITDGLIDLSISACPWLGSPLVRHPEQLCLSCSRVVRPNCRQKAVPDLACRVREPRVGHGVKQGSRSFSVELPEPVCSGV